MKNYEGLKLWLMTGLACVLLYNFICMKSNAMQTTLALPFQKIYHEILYIWLIVKDKYISQTCNIITSL